MVQSLCCCRRCRYVRIRYRRNGRGATPDLCVRPTRGEACDVRLAREIRSSTMPFLARMAFEVGRRRDDVTFRYEMEGLQSLRKVLRRGPVSGTLVVGVLRALVAMLGWQATGLARECYACFLPEHVYVDDGGSVRFLVVPLKGVRPRARDSPVGLLWAMSDVRHISFVTADDRMLAERLREFVLGEGETLSQMRLREFLREVVPGWEADMAARLGTGHVLRSEDAVRTWGLEEGRRYLMGRAANCDIRLGDAPTVSRRHATVWCDGDVAYVVDQDSTNGTFVDGRRLASGCVERLDVGQQFRLANEGFHIERGQ